MKSKDILLFSLVHDYLEIYLPKQRNVSPNTILSYRKALEELLDYVKKREQIPLGNISFEHLTADTIFAFLEYFELEKGYSISIRNARFAAIHAFMNYAAGHPDMVVVLLTNAGDFEKLNIVPAGTVSAGAEILRVPQAASVQ